MGQDVASQGFTRADRTRFRRKVHRCLDTFSQMLAESRFDVDDPCAGMEVEFSLVDEEGRPATSNAEVLAAVDDPAFQTELGLFNVEVNLLPRKLGHGGLRALEDDLQTKLSLAGRRASQLGAQLIMIGILPSLFREHMSDAYRTPSARYDLLNEQILLSRGEDVAIHIEGAEHLALTTDSIIPEAACTSTQLHIQVSAQEFPEYWNAAQAIAGVQAAVCANAPYFLAHRLWQETRIQLFTQAIDTRTEELKAQGVRPRVWFGERWISSIFDLFEENARYFPALLPECGDEDPIEALAVGRTPSLSELTLHNGTIWRWNRPVYDVVNGQPHLRVENRVLPSGPTVLDTLANAAFYFGLVRGLVEEERPVWDHLSFSAAADNFVAGARDGLGAAVYWPGTGTVGVTELVLRKLLPLAHQGLAAWGVEEAERTRFLGVIEERCLRMTNGAAWQVGAVDRLSEVRNLDRSAALHQMVRHYGEQMRGGEPVHAWATPAVPHVAGTTRVHASG